MKNLPIPLLAAVFITILITSAAAESIMVFVPHPGDESIAVAGPIHRARQLGLDVCLVALTNRDAGGRDAGLKRQQEFITAAAELGVPKESLVFLGYPQDGLLAMWREHVCRSKPYHAPALNWDHSPYDNSFTQQASFSLESLMDDLMRVVTSVRPSAIFAPHYLSTNDDHAGAAFFIYHALRFLHFQSTQPFRTSFFAYLIYGGPDWPPAGSEMADMAVVNPGGLAVDLVDFSPEMKLAKFKALNSYQQENGLWFGWIRSNELFWKIDLEQEVLPLPAANPLLDSYRRGLGSVHTYFRHLTGSQAKARNDKLKISDPQIVEKSMEQK